METGQTTGTETWSYSTLTVTTKSTEKVSMAKTLVTEKPDEAKVSRPVWEWRRGG
jgi:hypothetical protein